MEHVPKVIYDDKDKKWNLKSYDPTTKYSLTYVREDMPCGLVVTPSHVETDFTRKGRPEVNFEITTQGKWECAAASLAMLLGESLFATKRALGKAGWRNDDRGCGEQIVVDGARYLGRDLVKLEKDEVMEEGDKIGPCTLHIASLNVKGMGHGITWNGKEMLDPNWGRPGRKFWGSEWAPWTVNAWSALVLLDIKLSHRERMLHDKMMRKREEDKLYHILPNTTFRKVMGMK